MSEEVLKELPGIETTEFMTAVEEVRRLHREGLTAVFEIEAHADVIYTVRARRRLLPPRVLVCCRREEGEGERFIIRAVLPPPRSGDVEALLHHLRRGVSHFFEPFDAAYTTLCFMKMVYGERPASIDISIHGEGFVAEVILR